MKQEEEFKDAVAYIKSSTICTNKKFDWIQPLILKILDDKLCEQDIIQTLNYFLNKNKDINLEQTKEKILLAKPTKNQPVSNNSKIKKIISIDSASNVGLINFNQAIKLNPGLNVFYGRNGAGKSSIYLGLCKTLGKNKTIFGNVVSFTQKSNFQITCESENGQLYQMKWNSDTENEEIPIMIFDNLISNSLVKDDQINEFKVSHLKTEYFSLLYDLYEQIETKINDEINILNSEINTSKTILQEKVPFLFNTDFNWNINNVHLTNFTKDDEKKLEDLDNKINQIQSRDIVAVIKNLKYANDQIADLLYNFREVHDNDNRSDESELIFKLDKKYFDEINITIGNYLQLKTVFEGSKDKIRTLVPPEWFIKKTWDIFINSSIDFLNSLEVSKQNEYTKNKCPYCHQPLVTLEAKQLIKAYQQLHKEYEKEIRQAEYSLKEISDNLQILIEMLANKNMIPKNKIIEAEFENISKDSQKIEYNTSKLQKILQNLRDKILKEERIKITSNQLSEIKTFWNFYKNIKNLFENKIVELENGNKKKEQTIIFLNDKAQPLRTKRDCNVYKKDIVAYSTNNKILDSLNKKLHDLGVLKQITSSQKTNFFQTATLKEFQKHLKDEYILFGFLPPSKWIIKSSTPGGINKRVYSIGDRRLAEIFSEGEQKIHALSDFFAQCAVNNYSGVYIFDDPVSSLDENNIDNVANRILKLVGEGNQVIVFTHNLLFLNSIIDTQNEKCSLIERHDNQITILQDTEVGGKGELKKRLMEIENRIQKFYDGSLNKNNEYELRNVYDLISGYLENYLAIIMLNDIVGRYRSNIRMNSLGKLKAIDQNLLDQMINLYRIASQKGSRHGQPTDVSALKPTYIELKSHYDQLRNNFKLS